MRDGAKYIVGALAGTALTAAGFLLLHRPAEGPPGDAELAGSAARAGASDSGGQSATRGGASDSAGPSLSVGQKPASAEEAIYLEKALRDERRRRAEAIVRPNDTGLDVLRRVYEDKADLSDLLADFDKFASHVRHAEGRTVAWKGGEGVTKLTRDEAAGAVVLEFGPGTFVLERGRGGWGEFPEDVKALEIRGAGMDATTIRIADGRLIFAQKGVESLRMSGLTWECGSDSGVVLDTRGDVAVACEGVRFRTDGARATGPFYLEGRSYLGFRRCVFDGAGASSAVRLRGDVVALFESCSFLDLMAVLAVDQGTTREGVVRLQECDFEGSRLAYQWALLYRGRPPISIVVHGGRVEFGETGFSEARRREDWGASFAAVEGTVFGPDPSLPTVADLSRLLAAAAGETGAVPMDVRLKTLGRGSRAATYAVVVWDPVAKKAAAYLATIDGAAIRVATDPSGSTGSVNQALVASSRPLLEILNASSVPREAAARGAYFYTWSVGNKRVLAIHLESDDWPGWMIDAATAEALTRPDKTGNR